MSERDGIGKGHREKEEPFYAGQGRILELIAASAPLADILTRIVLLMEAQTDGLRCSILLLSHDGKHVRHGAAPNLPEAYVKAVDGLPIGPRVGSCGTSMYLRKQVVTTDVLTDPLWSDYRDLAKSCGLRACWSTPIISSHGDVLGSFAMYRQEPRGPNPEETRLTEAATHIASIAIERQQGHSMLREREARISLAAESADLAFWVLYPEQNTAWMGEMTASLGHELNQPLAAIANNAAAARRFFDRGQIDPAMLKELLADITAASHRAGEVINGIRGMARKGKSTRSRLNLNDVIRDTLRLVRSDILIRETAVVTDFDSLLPDVEAAPVQIQQVMLNLIMNALDAVEALPPPERRIIISTRSLKGKSAEVSVRDFGTGLPVDRAEKVFDHFFSTKAEGMGMGLTIARSIVEAHAGTLEAEDAEGGGALFFFHLPAAQRLPINKAA